MRSVSKFSVRVAAKRAYVCLCDLTLGVDELARSAAMNMGEHLGATETYLRMAFKAQAQCSATLETLAEVNYPAAATFLRQQNVGYQQLVNNGDGKQWGVFVGYLYSAYGRRR